MKSPTPRLDPATHPTSNTEPIFKSTFPRLQWARTPETELPTSRVDDDATEIASGMPIMINSGVIRLPRPTPNNHDRKSTLPPIPKIRKKLTETSSIGRYTCMMNDLLGEKIKQPKDNHGKGMPFLNSWHKIIRNPSIERKSP